MSEIDPHDAPVDRNVKVPHLVFGLFFLGVAAIWALVAWGAITADRLAVLGPGVLIGAGVIGLAASLANNRNRRRRHQSPSDATDRTESPDETQEIR